MLFHRYFYPGTTFAITEIDGVRIISSDQCDLIQKVPSKSPCSSSGSTDLMLLHSIVSVDLPTRFYIAISYSVRRMGELLPPFPQGR